MNEWTVRNWEKGRREPAIRLWPRVVEFLGYDPDPEPDGIGQRIKWTRRRRGLSIHEFARKLGVDPEALRRWERGIRIPRGKYLALVEPFVRDLRSGE